MVPVALMTFGWIAGTGAEHTTGGHTTIALWALLWVIWPTWIFMLDAEHAGTIAFMLVLAGVFNGVWYMAAATFFRHIGASLKRLASSLFRNS